MLRNLIDPDEKKLMSPHIYGQPVSKEDLRHLQLNCLEILLEIDRICRKNHIEYSLDGGSLLGAVRHGGFIPWDDDVDVCMSRREYLKFRKACKRDLNKDKFFFQDHTTDPNYPWGYGKMRLLGTELTRPGQEHLHCVTGVFSDIFVMDNVPDGYIARRVHYALCFVIRKLLYSQLGMVAEKSMIKRMFYSFCYHHIPREKVFRFRNMVAGICNRRETELVSQMTFPYPKRCKFGTPAKCFRAFRDIEFEGHVLRCFEDYDALLSTQYGDYMKLPPVEDRRPVLTIGELSLL